MGDVSAQENREGAARHAMAQLPPQFRAQLRRAITGIRCP